MTVALVPGGKPGRVGTVKIFHAAPMKEGSRVKENDHGDAGSDDHGKIDVSPRLSGGLRVGEAMERVGDHQDWDRERCAAKMNDVGFFRQDHAGHSHAAAPEVI